MAYGAWAFNGDLSMYANVTAALHGYVGPCGTEPGSAHEDQVPIGQVHRMWPTTVEGSPWPRAWLMIECRL